MMLLEKLLLKDKLGKYMKIKAFTLAEAMIMIAILGVITAAALPVLIKKDLKTDTSIRAASKAYGTLAQVVSGIVQDGYYYKEFDKYGFGDTSKGIDVLTVKTYDYIGDEKQKKQKKFNDILHDSIYAVNKNTEGDQFDTSDGIRWKLNWKDDTFNNLSKPLVILIDTNIKNGNDFKCNKLDKTQNCQYIDTVAFLLYRNGNVMIDGADGNSTIGVGENGNLVQTRGTFNDAEFVKKILGQHSDTQDVSSGYQKG